MSIRSARLLGGRYQLHTMLGRGGMAAVWAGIDTRLDRPVAVKVLDGAALANPAMVQRLEHEAKTLASLAHPNIVAGYDVGTEDGVPYLVMEFVEGQDLGRRLDAGRLDIEATVSIGVQICDALQAAHAAGVVHRDIKPENILITATGTVKVCDFGIARLLRASQAGLTGQATALGTSEYIAPEQATASSVDARADLYALGCVLYRMLAGRPPFTGDDPLRIMWRHVHEPPALVSALRPDVPAELDSLIHRLLAKNPADRPATAGEVRDRLAALVGPDPQHSAGAIGFGPYVPPAPPDEPRFARASVPARTEAMAAAVSQTRTMPALEAGGRHSRAGGGWRLGPLGIVGVAAVVAVITAVVVALAMAPQRQQTTAGPDASSAVGSAPATVGPEAGTVAAVRAAVTTALEAGDLDGRSAGDLGRRIDRIERDLSRGDTRNAAQRISELRDELDDLRRDDRLTDAGHNLIVASLDELAATVPMEDEDD